MQRSTHEPIYPKAFFAAARVPPAGTCFIIMPFSGEFDPVHRVIQSAAKAAGMRPKRADSVFEPKAILQKILSGIEESELVVADLTGRNANVFYELGIAQVRKDRTVLLTQDTEDVPFDLRHIEFLKYEQTTPGLRALQLRLTDVLKELAAPVRTEPDTEAIKVLYWSSSPRNRDGAGLVVENIGEEVALDLEAERVTPTGTYDSSRELGTLRPSERASFSTGWDPAGRPPDAPGEAKPGSYLTRVSWSDRSGQRHVGDWTDTEKR